MDDSGFDAVARRLAGAGTRRHFLLASVRLIATAALVRATAPAVKAQTSGIALGGACAAANECLGTGMATITCADNGIPTDGPLTCCVTQGCCVTDADCCGDMRCAPTGDVCSVCAFPPFPTRLLGETCAADDDCVASVVAAVSCLNGLCQAPGIETPVRGPGWRLDPDAALAAAEDLARIEARADYGALYARMHPDSQAVVPFSAMAGWYADEFAPRVPGAAQAVKVRFVDWIWPVTGQTYPNTAEVTYVQDFPWEPAVRDVVRLVMDHQGEWRWFFGRSRAFVDEQIATYR